MPGHIAAADCGSVEQSFTTWVVWAGFVGDGGRDFPLKHWGRGEGHHGGTVAQT